jgi:hypothetical protein
MSILGAAVRPASICFNAPMIYTSLCFPFAMDTSSSFRRIIYFPTDAEQVTSPTGTG